MAAVASAADLAAARYVPAVVAAPATAAAAGSIHVSISA